MMTALSVMLGGGVGALARFYINQLSYRLFGDGFPYGTLGVNCIGGFLMGVAFAYLQNHPENHTFKPLIMVGLLGGFTTFSTFSLDILLLLQRSEFILAGVYIVASVSMSLFALWLGYSASTFYYQ